jgi:TPR repeat protein
MLHGHAMMLTLRHVIAAIILVLSFAAPVAAGPLEDAVAAAARGDYATALRLWRPLADQGNALAQRNLGFMYANGQGVPQDYAEAVKWYRKAADQGDADAQFNLGAGYDNGQGVPQDYAEAVKWYRLAADQGVASAQYNLAVMYDNGQGVPQDYVRAYMWFNLAAAQGLQGAEEDRDQVAQQMTAAQIAEAQQLAREWKPTK